MGAWSVSIMGNDTAQDLKSEYQAAFWTYDVETAVDKIRIYAQQNLSDEDMPDYVYSLAMFMWKHGLLTDNVLQQVLDTLDSHAGLDSYEDAATLKKRMRVLNDFRNTILSPQPLKKKIKIEFNLEPVFEVGDMVALQLDTTHQWQHSSIKADEDLYRSYNGRYIVVRKIADNVSYVSSIVPSIKDIWPVFELYNYCSNRMPDTEEALKLKPFLVKKSSNAFSRKTPFRFVSDGKMKKYKKLNAAVITNKMEGIKKDSENEGNYVFWGHGAEEKVFLMLSTGFGISRI